MDRPLHARHDEDFADRGSVLATQRTKLAALGARLDAEDACQQRSRARTTV